MNGIKLETGPKYTTWVGKKFIKKQMMRLKQSLTGFANIYANKII